MQFKKRQWVFAITCACGRVHIVGAASTPSVPGVYAWPYQLNCDCEVDQLYKPGQIQRIQLAKDISL